MIKDSGSRREFETGAVRDIEDGKGRCDLMPLEVADKVFEDATDMILHNISMFQKYDKVRFLVNAFNIFSNKNFKSKEEALLEVSKHFEEGAKKYGEHNWEKGIPTHCYIDSAVRHYLKYLAGWTDERHDRAFLWNIMCCIWTADNKPELDNYRKDD